MELTTDTQQSTMNTHLLALREVYWPQEAPDGYSRIRWMSGSSTSLPATIKSRGRWWPKEGILVMQEMAGKGENWIRGETCRPVMCWDRTSVKSGLKLPPSNTSHPSVAMRPAITGALPPTVHLFPGMSRDASTNSLNRVSLSIKRLQGTEMWKRSVNTEDEPSENHLHSSPLLVPLIYLKIQINLVHLTESCYQKAASKDVTVWME